MTTTQTISNRAIIIIATAAVSAVFISSLFSYLNERERAKIEMEKSLVERERIAVENKRSDIEDKRADTERENVRLNATTKITLDKMTNCMKIMMEESRKDRSIPISPEKAKELCKDLQK